MTHLSTTLDDGVVSPLVLVEHEADLSTAILTLNRGAERNPLDMKTLLALRNQLEELSAEPVVRAIIITGAPPAFSAGGDLKAYEHLYAKPAEFQHFLDTFGQVCHLLESSAAITIAMINGVCVAGGLELALSCDFITMNESARVGDGHVQFAQLPGAGGSQRLVNAIGVQRAKDWLLTGRLVSAAEAKDAGLVALVAPAEQLREDTLALVKSSQQTSPLTLSRMKQLVRVAARSTLTEGLGLEKDIVFEYATKSADAREGLRAFRTRRPPHYLGR